jgi:pimeloyl-ACP methyl ester carboxylesterase
MHHSTDGVSLDIRVYGPEAAPRVALVLPCMGGDVHSYALGYEALAEAGYRVVAFNPRGHGASGGVWSLDDTLADLETYFRAHGVRERPVFAVGHSGGGTTVLTMAERGWPLERIALLAPVLDTRLSARFKYEHGTARELYIAFRPRQGDASVLSEVLASDAWLDAAHWEQQGLRRRIDDATRDAERPDYRAVTLLENIFLPGHVRRDALVAFGARAHVFLPAVASWFPNAETARVATEGRATVYTIESARDHFFRNGFDELAARLLATARLPSGAR